MRRKLSSVVAVTAILSACVSFGLMGSDASAADGTPATPLPASQVQVTKDVLYTEADGTRLTLDVYGPREAAPNRPAVVLIHGGAWGTGNAHDLAAEGKLIARQGWVAFSINYRLADQTSTPWPDELTDVQRAIRWVGANGSTYGADPSKLTVMGLLRRRPPRRPGRRRGHRRRRRRRPLVGPEPAGGGHRGGGVVAPVAPGRARAGRRGRPARLRRQQGVRPVLAPAAGQELPRLPARRLPRQVHRRRRPPPG